MKREYIYRLRDPRDGSIRYVGRTCDLKKRLTLHMTMAGGCMQKQEWIHTLRKLSLKAIMEVIEEVRTGVRSSEAELYWIYIYTQQGATLLNDFRILGNMWQERAIQEKINRGVEAQPDSILIVER